MDMRDVLVDYATTGGVGVLRPGAGLDAVTEVLGAPAEADYFPEPEGTWPRTFAYGDVRLEVCGCREIFQVALSTWTGTVEVPTGRPGEVVTLGSEVTFGELKELFAAAGVEWELGEPSTVTTQLTVVVGEYPKNVDYTFAVSDPATPDAATLHSVIAKDVEHAC
ncbi:MULTISPECIES: hypothetical protein [unclassified Streptomyces]|uniref:hypothetical protein n=1 Tax=unclassified Streptomyces TaxID=2593676 RepID=UPI000DD6CC99|nr:MULTISPECIES: hypothetical protein [unclassified Streptomyces]QZZ25406.1 hypothetical protein A7X85_03055 [Streptomyces sp. ST1015]